MSLVGLLVLAAVPVAAAPPASRTPPEHSQCRVGKVRPITRTGAARRSRAWSVRQVVDLQFEARVRPEAESAGLEFRVYTPGGHLYRTLEASVGGDRPGRSGQAKGKSRHAVQAVLPVAGTGIVRNGLYGRWRVVPHLVGDSRPCGRAVPFDLAP